MGDNKDGSHIPLRIAVWQSREDEELEENREPIALEVLGMSFGEDGLSSAILDVFVKIPSEKEVK